MADPTRAPQTFEPGDTVLVFTLTGWRPMPVEWVRDTRHGQLLGVRDPEDGVRFTAYASVVRAAS